jgi:hypothetical protein
MEAYTPTVAQLAITVADGPRSIRAVSQQAIKERISVLGPDSAVVVHCSLLFLFLLLLRDLNLWRETYCLYFLKKFRFMWVGSSVFLAAMRAFSLSEKTLWKHFGPQLGFLFSEEEAIVSPPTGFSLCHSHGFFLSPERMRDPLSIFFFFIYASFVWRVESGEPRGRRPPRLTCASMAEAAGDCLPVTFGGRSGRISSRIRMQMRGSRRR